MARRTRIILLFLLSLNGILGVSARGTEQSAADLEFFEKRVRPVLVERCYKCHSAQSEKVKGHLLLDTREGWQKGGDGGPAVKPGDPDHSLLIEAVRYTNADMEMPPKGKLADAEIATLVEWVKRGAPDPRTGAATTVAKAKGIDLEAGRKFWAYQPIRNSAVPVVKDAAWPRGDIDRFILAKLEAKALRPVADAEPTALLRRLYFDLIGLPPTPEQIDAFVSDPSPARYERVVDELLTSPQFGERWGRHWLDVARFAESLTLRGFVLKDAWRYRDYVIETFNHDRPFDKFMQEQVAGDLLPAASIEEGRRQLTGSAFLALGNTNLEEQDKKQLEMDVVDEQLDTLGRAFLAQTIGCARCHDHKFDPIPTKDYYALAGILHSTQTLEHSNVSKWLEMPLPTDPAREATLKKREAAIAELQAKVKEAKAAVAKANKAKPGKKSNEVSTAIADLAGIVVDDAQAKRIGTWKESTSVKPYIGDGYLFDDGDRKESKTLTFLFEVPEAGRYEVRFAYTPAPRRATNAPVTVFSADGEKTITVNEREAPAIEGHFVSLGQYAFEKNGQSFVIVSTQDVDGTVIADAVQFIPVNATGATAVTPPAVADAGSKNDAPAQRVKQLEAELKVLTEAGPQRETIISVREAKEIGDTRVHIRGNVHTLSDPAPRGFLRVIAMPHPPAIPEKQSGRRELGEWLASPENPLPARVMANRVWHWLTGAGIVRTTDNFGTTGELPSHPELLDHLASRFIADGWSLKTLVRQVVLSHAYQLSTANDANGLRVDPENRLMWRMNRRRLDAECIRDAMLAVDGQLKEEGGGATFKAGMTSDFSYKQADNRRSVYLPVFRNSLPEVFEAFDFADPSVGTGRRNVSTVAPQALFMMNHPWVAEQARAAATRLLAEKQWTDDRARLARAYRLTLGRAATPAEERAGLAFVKDSAAEPAVEAWAQVFHALFASMDFRYVD
jgi:hypothetical protein